MIELIASPKKKTGQIAAPEKTIRTRRRMANDI